MRARRKQAGYARVLAALDGALGSESFRHVRHHLAAVVEPQRSSVFGQIIY
jgi:hypothetical protein